MPRTRKKKVRAKHGRTAAPLVERKYEVRAALTNFTLAKAKSALTLELYRRDVKLGELQVGRGSLYWSGAHRQKEKRISWGQVAKMLNTLAYGESGTTSAE